MKKFNTGDMAYVMFVREVWQRLQVVRPDGHRIELCLVASEGADNGKMCVTHPETGHKYLVYDSQVFKTRQECIDGFVSTLNN